MCKAGNGDGFNRKRHQKTKKNEIQWSNFIIKVESDVKNTVNTDP